MGNWQIRGVISRLRDWVRDWVRGYQVIQHTRTDYRATGGGLITHTLIRRTRGNKKGNTLLVNPDALERLGARVTDDPEWYRGRVVDHDCG